jgi:hypothetical protein
MMSHFHSLDDPDTNMFFDITGIIKYLHTSTTLLGDARNPRLIPRVTATNAITMFTIFRRKAMNRHTKSFRSFQRSSAFLFLSVCCFVTLFSSGCTKEGPAGPPGDDNLSNPAVKPTVIFTLPGNGATGPFTNLFGGSSYTNLPHFVVRFNKLMNKLGFRDDLITIQGSGQTLKAELFYNYYYRDGIRKISSNYDDVLEFSIRDSASYSQEVYQIGKSYTVTLNPGVEDINGNLTELAYQFSYMPEPYFRVRKVYPRDGTPNAWPNENVSLRFNSFVDAGILPFLHLAPAIAGQWRVDSYDSTRVFFQPSDGRLAFNQDYTVSVDPTARDRNGNQINGTFTSSFHVQPFGVSLTSPSDGATNVNPNRNTIYIGFNGPVDTSTVRLAFNISPPVDGALEMYAYGNSIYYNTASGFTPQTTYTVSLSTSLTSADGTPLQSPYHFSFTTLPFQVTYTYPQNGQTLVPLQTTIGIDFNTYLDTGSVRAAFSINPPVSGLFSFSYYGNSSFYYSPSLLSANTTYTVTISTALRTKGGGYLQAPYMFSFRTTPLDN